MDGSARLSSLSQETRSLLTMVILRFVSSIQNALRLRERTFKFFERRKPLPVIVSVVPPSFGPAAGAIALRTGGAASGRGWLASVVTREIVPLLPWNEEKRARRTLVPVGSAVVGASRRALDGPQGPEGDQQEKSPPHGRFPNTSPARRSLCRRGTRPDGKALFAGGSSECAMRAD